LLVTLEQSTERVDELVLATTRRFIDVFGGELSSSRPEPPLMLVTSAN
jgi:hypothetical protein